MGGWMDKGAGVVSTVLVLEHFQMDFASQGVLPRGKQCWSSGWGCWELLRCLWP